MTPTATQILDHCKAVVNGEIPQPELLRVEADDHYCRIYYANSKQVVWAFSLNSSGAALAIAARILGLDRPSPAPVTLPLDDEIAFAASDESNGQDFHKLDYRPVWRDGFEDGAKWMRSQVKAWEDGK